MGEGWDGDGDGMGTGWDNTPGEHPVSRIIRIFIYCFYYTERILMGALLQVEMAAIARAEGR